MIVFPESMNEARSGSANEAISVMQAYIKYMCQRVEWAMGNVTKDVSKAGISSAEMYILLSALQNTVAALQSTVNSQAASISSLLQGVSTLNNDYAELAERMATAENNYTALEARVTALEARVTALENTEV